MFYALTFCVTLILGTSGHPVWAAVLGFTVLLGAVWVQALRLLVELPAVLDDDLDGDDD